MSADGFPTMSPRTFSRENVFDVIGLTLNTTYRVRVRAFTGFSQPGEYSALVNAATSFAGMSLSLFISTLPPILPLSGPSPPPHPPVVEPPTVSNVAINDLQATLIIGLRTGFGGIRNYQVFVSINEALTDTALLGIPNTVNNE